MQSTDQIRTEARLFNVLLLSSSARAQKDPLPTLRVWPSWARRRRSVKISRSRWEGRSEHSALERTESCPSSLRSALRRCVNWRTVATGGQEELITCSAKKGQAPHRPKQILKSECLVALQACSEFEWERYIGERKEDRSALSGLRSDLHVNGRDLCFAE